MFGLGAPCVIPSGPSLDAVLAVLRSLRLTQAGMAEAAIVDALSDALAKAMIRHQRERKFGPRCRADIWIDGIIVEVKKQRPPAAALDFQLARYAMQPGVRAIILVLERSIGIRDDYDVPVHVVSLNSLWGVAV